MKEENMKCLRCWYCNRYYTKGIKHFNKTELGWCTVLQSEVNINSYCEKFNSRLKSKRIKRTIKNSLNDLLTEISEIRKYVELEQSDEDE